MKTFLKHSYFVFISLIAISIFIACNTQQKTLYNRRLNLSFLYNPNLQTLKAKVIIFNAHDTTSIVYCKIPVKSLLYLQADTVEIATINVHYKLFKTSTGLQLKDTLTVAHSFVKKLNKTDELLTFNLHTTDTGQYMLDLYITDKNSYAAYHNYLYIERLKKYSDNDFLLLNKNGEPYFDKWLIEQDTFYIRTKNNMPGEWKIAWYPNSFKNASPPYSLSTNKDFVIPSPDSIKATLICDTCFFIANRKGIMHFYSDSVGNGKTIFVFTKDFPQMTRPSELLQPIRMLTSQKEFNELNIIADKKEAVDKFWLNTAGNIERAREIIRIYYTRAILANQYFTSYTEGWKTDRGMIYIIFGLPTTIFKASNIEQWIYGTPESTKTLVFTFIKKYHPFSNNHFVLERNESYKISWLQAIDTWRNGRVFSIAN